MLDKAVAQHAGVAARLFSGMEAGRERVFVTSPHGWRPSRQDAAAAATLALGSLERVVVTGSPTPDGWCSGHRLGAPDEAGWFPVHYIEELTEQEQEPPEDGDATESDDDDEFSEDDDDTIFAADRTAVVLLEQREAATAGASPPRAPLRTAATLRSARRLHLRRHPRCRARCCARPPEATDSRWTHGWSSAVSPWAEPQRSLALPLACTC